VRKSGRTQAAKWSEAGRVDRRCAEGKLKSCKRQSEGEENVNSFDPPRLNRKVYAECRNRSNPFYKCGVFCRDQILATLNSSPKLMASSLLEGRVQNPSFKLDLDPPPLDSSPCALGDTEVVLSGDPVNFYIPEECVDAAVADVGNRSLII